MARDVRSQGELQVQADDHEAGGCEGKSPKSGSQVNPHPSLCRKNRRYVLSRRLGSNQIPSTHVTKLCWPLLAYLPATPHGSSSWSIGRHSSSTRAQNGY